MISCIQFYLSLRRIIIMRSTHLNIHEQLKKTASSHFKRYSEHDLKNGSINNLLITQSNAFSKLKFRSLKTKLPQISTSSTQSFSNSYSKVGRIGQALNELSTDMVSLNCDLDNSRINFDSIKRNSEERLQKNTTTLGGKVQRLRKILDYTIKQDHKRNEKIQQSCKSLKRNNDYLKQRIDEIRLRLKHLEDDLGIYTGEDKYLV